jgi:hypothetical protein
MVFYEYSMFIHQWKFFTVILWKVALANANHSIIPIWFSFLQYIVLFMNEKAFKEVDI